MMINRHRTFIGLSYLAACLWIASCAPVGSDDNSAMVGKPAADFSLASTDSHQVKLSEMKGSVVVLDFWATWCAPCRASLPNLNRLSQDATLAARGLKVVAVNSQETPDVVKAFLQANHYSLPVVLDTDGSVEQQYQATALPTTVVVGRDGSVVYATQGFSPDTSETELNAAIEKALGK